jgi:hypothetical protein
MKYIDLFGIPLKPRIQPCFPLPLLLALALLACAIACGGSGAGSVDHLNDDDSPPSDDDNDDDNDDNDDATPHWSVMWTGEPGSFFGVWGSSALDVFASGDQPLSGMFLHYDGSSWSPVPGVPSTDYLSAIWGSSATDVYAAGIVSAGADSGTILHYDGSDWSAAPGIPPTCGFSSIWGSSATDVFAVGGCGYTPCVFHYDGSAWSAMSGIPPTCSLLAIWGTAATDVFAVGGCDDAPSVFNYDGSAWSAMTIQNGMTGAFGSVWGTSASDVFAGGAGIWGSSWSDVFTIGDPNGTLHYDGSAWSPMTGPQRLEVLSAPLGTRASDNGYHWIWHYDGFTWSGMTLPALPGPTANGYFATPILRAIWGSSPSDVFAVGQYSHGGDYGKAWMSIIYHYGY